MNMRVSSLRGCFVSVLLVTAGSLYAQQDCIDCHSDVVAKWGGGAHANTQTNVAIELSQSSVGLTPADVVNSEDCIACHGPTAVLLNGGMTESQALGYFFTTMNGVFGTATKATNTTVWPHVSCVTCHNVPNDHPASLPGLALFNSQTKQYVSTDTASTLCGQCHGNLHFAGSDHLIYNAWTNSTHAHTQVDVANELSVSDAGLTPAAVIQDENCIGCHSPTAVLANGGTTESGALGYFFTTSNGLFTASTVAAHSTDWPGVDCTACHDPHAPGQPAYFNSATQQYQVMTNSAQLCGQCHGNLRFPGTDHLSYNLMTGTGGIGVTNQQTMPGVTCTDCHMYSSAVDGSNSKNLHGHTWAITVTEAGGQTTTSCTVCHAGMDTAAANTSIATAQAEFQALDATVQANVTRVAAAMDYAPNATWQAALEEAQFNLGYAESDESRGFHNHAYLMALLRDANAKALSIPVLNVTVQPGEVIVSWTSAGTLQSAGSIGGPWQDVPNATNSWIIPRAAQTQGQFYRLRP